MEMLIVIGIIAVLAVVVVTVLNPVEFLKKSRDGRRMVDLQSLDKALRLADFDNISMGAANVVYVSIPDDTSATSTCPTLGLPALPGGWSYQCSNTANYRKADGTGWVPVNFNSLTTVSSPLTLLPVDPTNSTSTNLYYSYVSGSWELTALFETTGYQTKYASADNGTSTVLYEVGNHLKITPNAVASRTNTGGGGGGPTVTVPTLTTSAATDLAATTATLNGSITAEGGASSTIVGFQYGLTTSYGSEATSTYTGGTGAFSKAITGLTASTLYYFKAEAKNSQGWGYGSDATLTTGAPAPQIGYVDPNGEVSHNELWARPVIEPSPPDYLPIPYYIFIDDGIRQPNTPDTSDYLESSGYGDVVLDMSTITNVASVTNVTVWAYANGPDIIVQGAIKMNGTWTTLTDFGFTSSASWKSVSFNGTWTQTDLNNLQVKLNVPQWGSGNIYAMYAVVTYTP